MTFPRPQGYRQLLAATDPAPDGLSLEEPSAPSAASFDEMEVQALWFSGLLPDRYRTIEGQDVTIISPGEWNRGAGPDFLRATIELDGEKRTGGLEIDLTSTNWELHGHANNAAFDDVILHLVLEDAGPTFFTRTNADRSVPRAVIPQPEVLAALGKPRLTQALARPGRCLHPLAQMDDEAVEQLLAQACRHRFSLKARRFERIERTHGFSQALWESLADCLGFSANRLPMRLLAQRLPIKVLRPLNPLTRQALLFGCAGFLLPELHQEAPPESQRWLETLWQEWWKLRPEFEFPPERRPKWHLGGSRPGNHPQRRLAALAAAAEHWPRLLKEAGGKPPFSLLKKSLISFTDSFWDNHYTLKSSPTARPQALLGKSRTEEFLINTLFPLALDSPSARKAWEIFERRPAPSPNQKVKRCAERLFGTSTRSKPWLKLAWQQQGLLQIYQDFCLEDVSGCADCPFPEQLSNFQPDPR